jgi:hypothetical protein
MQAAHRGTFTLDRMRQEFQALTLTIRELPASSAGSSAQMDMRRVIRI